MGDDLAVVNAARVSFDGESDWEPDDYVSDPEGIFKQVYSYKLSEKDKGLIQFLARGCSSKDWENKLKHAASLGMNWLYWGTPGSKDKFESFIKEIQRIPKHWVPFANGGTIMLHFEVPIFVARQLQKHQAGFEPQSEISRRYVTSDVKCFIPDVWRKSAENVKQGSSNEPI